jgi:hypothetical protein
LADLASDLDGFPKIPFTMMSLSAIRATRFFSFCLAGFLVSGQAVISGAGANRLRIERWSPTGDEVEFDESVVQQIAQQLGVGHFLVRDMIVDGSDSPVKTVRIFSVYSSMVAVQSNSPVLHILCRTGANDAVVKAGNAEEMIRCFFSVPESGSTVEESASHLMPGVVSALLYGESGRWCKGDAPADRVPAGSNRFSSGEQVELNDILHKPEVWRDQAGRLAWRGDYFRGDGGIEEITVTFPIESSDRPLMDRVELKPSGYRAKDVEANQPAEEWTVVNASSWRPPQRYRMLVMMAALGNASKQFQLGAALLQESDEGARAEGFKWLRAAAAQGWRDAVDLLEQSAEQSERPDRDRDKVRITRCCPVPGR